VLEKLEKVNKLVIQVWKVADALERMAEMRSKTLEDDIISWLESRGEKMETLERVDKGKQREQSSDGAEKEEEVEEQEKEDAMEGVEEENSSFSLVVLKGCKRELHTGTNKTMLCQLPIAC